MFYRLPMKFRNVRLLFRREMVDQFRDRRTLLMIFVVPILLYPLLGVFFLQTAQFIQDKPSRVLVLLQDGLLRGQSQPQLLVSLADQQLPDFSQSPQSSASTQSPKLDQAHKLAESRESGKSSGSGQTARLDQTPSLTESVSLPESANLDYRFADHGFQTVEEGQQIAQRAIAKGEADTVLLLSKPYLSDQRTVQGNQTDQPFSATSTVLFSSAQESSVLASSRLEKVLRDWNDSLGIGELEKRGIDPTILEPIKVMSQDLTAHSVYEGASFWSKILPVLLLLWTLTGAFYPAIDLCAGEKERGTLETLLCSPATRNEIVLGKLLTVTTFSTLSAVLNLLSIFLTGSVLAAQIPGVLPPPLLPTLGLFLPLLPVALMFSAICLALASLAKSTKEGQYYLLPVMMITFPLVFLSLAPGTELTLGTALIPLTGLSLILRNWLEGNLGQVLRFLPIVLTITFLCCLFSVRLAVSRFKQESLLFNDSRPFNLPLWLRDLFNRHRTSPTFSAALFCGILILVLKYFLMFVFTKMDSFAEFFLATLSLQIGAIALPPLLLAFFGTADCQGTLGFRQNGLTVSRTFKNCFYAVLSALSLYPLLLFLSEQISYLYPLSQSQQELIRGLNQIAENAPFPLLLLLFALIPAFCEEIAFRGYILHGFLRNSSETMKNRWDAILLSAFFFGITHSLLQQSLSATIIGCLLGYIAIQAGQIWPCIAFHFVHNALAVTLPQFGCSIPSSPLLALLVLFPSLLFLKRIKKS
ncbi:MAG: ABC transporter permease subunit/CPBP intramembrane protease [Thermoguttaceae bacterium]